MKIESWKLKNGNERKWIQKIKKNKKQFLKKISTSTLPPSINIQTQTHKYMSTEFQKENNTNSPLFLKFEEYIQNGNIEAIKLLLEQRASINQEGILGQGLVHMACFYDQDEILKLLLDKGSNIDRLDSSNRTPLFYACVNGSVDVVSTLIQRGCNVNWIDKDDDTAFFRACKRKKSDIVKILLDNGFNVELENQWGTTAVLHTCSVGNKEILDMLIEKGCNLNHRDKLLDNPLILACINENVEIVQSLLNTNLDVDVENSDGNTPVFYSCRSADERILKLLIEKKCNLNHKNGSGTTPLHMAIAHDLVGKVRILIENGAYLDMKNNDGKTPIECCFTKYPYVEEIILVCRKDIAVMLIDYGSSIPEYLKGEPILKTIMEEVREKRRSRIGLLLCTRKFCPESLFFHQNLPLDLLKYIFFLSGLINHPVRNDEDCFDVNFKKLKAEKQEIKKN